MIRVICDRCGKDITGQEELGYISMLYRHTKDGDVSNCELMGMNPWEKNHYCEECMEQISEFIKYVPCEKQDTSKEPPKRRARHMQIKSIR